MMLVYAGADKTYAHWEESDVAQALPLLQRTHQPYRDFSPDKVKLPKDSLSRGNLAWFYSAHESRGAPVNEALVLGGNVEDEFESLEELARGAEFVIGVRQPLDKQTPDVRIYTFKRNGVDLRLRKDKMPQNTYLWLPETEPIAAPLLSGIGIINDNGNSVEHLDRSQLIDLVSAASR